MAATKRINFEKPKLDSWVDQMTDDQFVKLSDFVGKTIAIRKAFLYDSKKLGSKGMTLQFEADGKVYYSTSFGRAIVNQASQIIAALDADPDTAIEVTVLRQKSKTGAEYIVFA